MRETRNSSLKGLKPAKNAKQAAVANVNKKVDLAPRVEKMVKKRKTDTGPTPTEAKKLKKAAKAKEVESNARKRNAIDKSSAKSRPVNETEMAMADEPSKTAYERLLRKVNQNRAQCELNSKG